MALCLPRALAARAPCGFSAGRGQRLSIVTHAQVNPSIKKDVDKVVDMLKVEDMPKKVSCSRRVKKTYGISFVHNISLPSQHSLWLD